MDLCHASDLADGESRGFDPHGSGRDTLFLVRRGERVNAWLDSCPHEPGTPMAWRRHAYLNAARDRIVCHAHGAQFDLDSGVCLLGPCLGQRLTPVDVQLSSDGRVHLTTTIPPHHTP